MRRRLLLLPTLLFSFATLAYAQSPSLTPTQALARDIFRELIGIDTTDEHGATTPAAEALARRLREAGLPAADVQVLGPTPKKANLVARLRGTGAKRPLLLLAHLDVVEARREDWTVDPFTLLERDGFFYGRGAEDVKDGAAIMTANVIQFIKEGYRPDRDLILALTADEEGGTSNGVQWLLAEHRDLIDAELCLNFDGGDFEALGTRRVSGAIQAAEKGYADFTLEVTDAGGHSSLPRPGNAIYRLSAGLLRVADFTFPVHLNEVTRSFFARRASLESGQRAADMREAGSDNPPAAAVGRLSSDMYYNALLRTTCVATLVTAGHAANALPQRARANVNCRIVPGETEEEVRNTLVRVLSDPTISVSHPAPRQNPASPLRPDVLAAVDRATAAVYPGLPIIPTMETGATDGRLLRGAGIPTYGISGVFLDDLDDRSHGRDERVGVRDFYDGLAFNDHLIRAMSGH
jgi:acetylornithine deacetylase/succinyl-diaminopimelate desuccinylase-like protein